MYTYFRNQHNGEESLKKLSQEILYLLWNTKVHYHDTIHLTLRSLSVFKILQCDNIILFTFMSTYLYTYFTILILLSLAVSCKLSFQTVGMEIFSFSTSAFKSQQIFHMVLMELTEYMYHFLIKKKVVVESWFQRI